MCYRALRYDGQELPLALVGTADGALTLRADAPAEIPVSVALLIALDIRVRRWRRHT